MKTLLRTPSLCAFLAALLTVQFALGAGLWSRSSEDDHKTTKKPAAASKKNSEPGFWDKIQFWKPSKPAKKPSPYGGTMVKPIPTAKKPPEKKGWFGSKVAKDEPKKPQSVEEWMELKRIDP